MNTLSLDIDGMTCAHCATRVRGALEAQPGVVVESLDQGHARLRLEADAPPSDAIAAAVSEAGYPARVANP